MPKIGGGAPEPKLAEKMPMLAENLSNATVSTSTGLDPSVSVGGGGEWMKSVSGTKLAGTSAGSEFCGTSPSGTTKLIGSGAESAVSPGGVLEPCVQCSFV